MILLWDRHLELETTPLAWIQNISDFQPSVSALVFFVSVQQLTGISQEGDLILQSYRRHLINDQLLTAEIPTFSYLFADPDAVAVPDFVSGPTAPGSLGGLSRNWVHLTNQFL